MIGNQSKYRKIIRHVTDGIENGTFKKGDRIPSINDFIGIYGLARDTVFKGIRELKTKGIIDSYPGLGYFVATTQIEFKRKIFLLFNEFNVFKEDMFNSFMHEIGDNAKVDLYFHNYNRRVFESLLLDANKRYTTYVLMPGKFSGLENVLKKITGRIILLDHFNSELQGEYASVYQNFEKDTLEALEFGLTHFKKYKRFVMVQQDEKEPIERYYGLKAFCLKHNFSHSYVSSVRGKKITPSTVYIVVDDRELVYLIKQAGLQGLQLGSDFGIVSINETPLKEVAGGGITTLSTDFTLMGKTLAELVQQKKKREIENPWKLTIRSSV